MNWPELKAFARRSAKPARMPERMTPSAHTCTLAELEALDLIARDALLREGWILCDEGEGDWSTIPPALQEWEGPRRVPATPMPMGAVDSFR